MKHSFILFVLCLQTIIPTWAQLVISEVQYTNRSTVYDSEGDTPDWIELSNISNISINLKDYALADKSDTEVVWNFPSRTINPGEYILVFASGKDRKSDTELHTDFKLRSMQDTLFLLKPQGAISGNRQGEIVQLISPQCVPADKSLGLYPTVHGELSVMSPTPQQPNATAELFQIHYIPDSISANIESGIYADNTKLSFTNIHKENTIRYTMDADVPDDRSEQFHTPIELHDISNTDNRFANKGDSEFQTGNLISKANIVRAQVYSNGCPASEEFIGSYFISQQNAFEYNVPIVSLITEKDNLFDQEIGIAVLGTHSNYYQHGKDWERPVNIKMFDTAGIKVIDQNAGMRVHGRATRAEDQKSFRLYARDKYGKASFEHQFFSEKPDLQSFERLLLRTVNGDWSGTCLKDDLCQYLVKDMNMDYTASEPVVVFVNGEYWGIYSLRERQDEKYVSNNFAIEDAEIETVAYFPSSDPVFENDAQRAYQDLTDFVSQNDPKSQTFYGKLSEQIDIDAYVDYYIAQLYLANTDWPGNNVEMWRLKSDTARWRMFFFDLDGAMFRANHNILQEYKTPSGAYPDFVTLILGRALQNPQFEQQFNQKFIYTLNTHFAPNTVLSAIKKYEAIYSPLMNEHIYRWGYPVDKNKWKHNLEILKSFAIDRPNQMNDQLSNILGNPITIGPNPSSGYISFYVPEGIEGTLSIFSAQGSLVCSAQLAQGQENSFTHWLPSGVYTTQIQVLGNIFSEPLIVE